MPFVVLFVIGAAAWLALCKYLPKEDVGSGPDITTHHKEEGS